MFVISPSAPQTNATPCVNGSLLFLGTLVTKRGKTLHPDTRTQPNVKTQERRPCRHLYVEYNP
jgi:hypothetical protein